MSDPEVFRAVNYEHDNPDGSHTKGDIATMHLGGNSNNYQADVYSSSQTTTSSSSQSSAGGSAKAGFDSSKLNADTLQQMLFSVKKGITKVVDYYDKKKNKTDERGPHWVSDDNASNCMMCNSPFTLIHRRHHCRKCGKVLCDSCSKGRTQISDPASPTPKPGQKEARVCKNCEVIVK